MNLKCTTKKFNGRQIKIYESAYRGKSMAFASAVEALLFGMGYGSDQAAELHYMNMKMKTQQNIRRR